MTFAVGQVWTFAGTEDIPTLTAIIGRIDTAQELGGPEEGNAVLSICLIPDADAHADGWPEVDHMPISAAAFLGDGSATGTAPIPDGFEEGYATWRAAFDAGEAGVFTLSPPEAYAAVVSLTAEPG